MAKTAQDVMRLIQELGIKMVDFKIVSMGSRPSRSAHQWGLGGFSGCGWVRGHAADALGLGNAQQ